MKITHLITGLGTGGAERMLVKLLQSFDHSAMAHRVISLTGAGAQAAAIRALGIPVDTLDLRGIAASPGGLIVLRRMLRDTRPDLVHGWMYHGALAGLLAAPNCPTIIGVRHSLHDISLEKSTTRLVIRSLRHLSHRAAAVVYCSRVSREQHRQFGFHDGKDYLIPNGFDCEAYRSDPAARRATRTSFGLSETAFVIGHLGRFHPMKDHATFLRAARLLLERGKDAQFILAGPGVTSEDPALARLLESEGLRDRVRLLGERRDVPDLLNAFDLLASSSAWGEAFPNVLGEAMACALPCVATDIGDSAYILGETGRIVPPRDPEALADTWADYIKASPRERRARGEAARRRVEEHFSLATVAQRYEDLYRRLIAD